MLILYIKELKLRKVKKMQVCLTAECHLTLSPHHGVLQYLLYAHVPIPQILSSLKIGAQSSTYPKSTIKPKQRSDY